MEKYNNLGEIKNYMANLRFGYLVGSLGKLPESIMDVGYGNGDFLKACYTIPKRFGYDVSGYPLPGGCIESNDLLNTPVEVTTFFDSLEHFEDPYIIKNLKSNFIIISVPECHYYSDEWFEDWKHRRPDEHLWHFNKKSLISFMNDVGYFCINTNNMEDCIRKSDFTYSNILTGCFKRK
jgi:hypothetical protein